MAICVSCMNTFAAWDGERCCFRCSPRPKTDPRVTAPKGPAVPFDKTDGGRVDDGFYSENNDCTVRALAVATGRPYREAHSWLQRRGRRMRRGCGFYLIMEQHGSNVLGHKLELWPQLYPPGSVGHRRQQEQGVVRGIYKSKGLKTAIERNPQIAVGTWIIHSTQHVAVLKDGKLLDSFDSSRKIIDKAWRVLPHTEMERCSHE